MNNIKKIQKLAMLAFFTARTKHFSGNGSVYSYESSQYYNFSFTKNSNVIGIFDFQRGNYISANRVGSGWSIYDYNINNFINLKATSTGYTGFDYDTSNHLKIDINGRNIKIFDYSDSSYYSFSF